MYPCTLIFFKSPWKLHWLWLHFCAGNSFMSTFSWQVDWNNVNLYSYLDHHLNAYFSFFLVLTFYLILQLNNPIWMNSSYFPYLGKNRTMKYKFILSMTSSKYWFFIWLLHVMLKSQISSFNLKLPQCSDFWHPRCERNDVKQKNFLTEQDDDR